jgi:molybdopterin/thiamine biosynthesis adenylyltransferase/predicted N-acetyltransferase YhbS
MVWIMESPWVFTAFRAPADPDAAPDALREIRRLRARILFDEGRRPAFRGHTGDHPDEQPQDHGAWHFTAHRTRDGVHGPPLGYVRLLTPATAALYQSREFLGDARYDEVLRAEDLAPDSVFEHSRLVVEHRARKLGLGLHLNALAVAAAHELGAAAMIGTSGTADGQDRFHARFGFHPVPSTRRYVEHYTEDVVILLHRTDGGAGDHSALVEDYRLLFRYDLMDAADGLDRRPGLGARRAAEPEPAFTVPAPARKAPTHAPPRRLTTIGPADPHRWKPVLFRPARPDDRLALAALLNTGAVREVADTIEAQLDELIQARDPARAPSPEALAAARRDQLEGAQTWTYGTWAWYSWAGRLVHVLPREEFRMVRTDRNRGKIDRPEQRRLLDKRVGVIGLSVGNSAALTLAQEGVAGAFKLADFDTLSVSNLNRLRAGLHQLGVNKAVLAARQMFEIDPYLDIEIFPAGLTEDTVREFFLGGHGPIDLLVEECDTPWVKLAAREAARELGVPVVMDTNDRGLLDVERYDREPHRPLLHGRLGPLTSEDCLDLDRGERVRLIMDMVDPERISPALAAATARIGSSLSSWPQLASGVALGGALVTDAARRILLGGPCESGRYYVDLEELIAPDRNQAAVSGCAAPAAGSGAGSGAGSSAGSGAGSTARPAAYSPADPAIGPAAGDQADFSLPSAP